MPRSTVGKQLKSRSSPNMDSSHHHRHHHHIVEDTNEVLLEFDKKLEKNDIPALDTATEDSKFFDSSETIIRPREFVLLDYHQVPKFLADNEFILSGYRVHFGFKLCLHSLFRWHNETLNVWTHLLGFLMFFGSMIYTFSFTLRNQTHGVYLGDYFVFATYFFGAHAQMGFSATYHWFAAYSADAAKWLARLDYMGICLMIVGSYCPPLYYMLRPCHPTMMTVHMGIIAFLGVVGVAVTTLPRLQGPKYRTFRAVYFIIFGLYVFVPLPQMIWSLGISYVWPMLWRLGAMGMIYIAGAIIYASRYPERCCPGKYDYGWSSHPIWHVFVVVAGTLQFFNCRYALHTYGPIATRS
eukprot:TRINITY_DN6746_c0_g1_i1.p1 TRINITY_DN6746_c0_g1~~TRINITY_DN6746_c0_g1_i1.p1  ORF type:complete len:353 (-),score=56.35 TRINITY_DN6746_c0_g1_i1:173-1231(-)